MGDRVEACKGYWVREVGDWIGDLGERSDEDWLGELVYMGG